MNFSEIISWLNQNTGVTNAILTTVYVVATIIIMLLNRKTVEEMRIARHQQFKPEILISFETRRKGLMCLVLKNYGGSPAKDLSIDMNEEFMECLSKRRETFQKLKNASLIIVPKQEWIISLGGPGIFEALGKTKLQGNLIYKDIYGQEYNQTFSIDFSSYGDMLVYGPELDELTSTIHQGFEDIKKEMQSIFKKISS